MPEAPPPVCPRVLTVAPDPKAFLDDVFQAITNKSYMPGAPPAPKPNANTDTTSNLPPRPPNLRKRGLDDDDDFREYDGYPQQGERAYKQPRRGGRRNGGFGGYMPPGGMANMPRFDPNNPMEALMTMQAMGMPFPNMPDYGGQGAANRQRRRGRCRDFDNKGYCSRGSTCAYDHSQEPIYSDGPGGKFPRHAVLSDATNETAADYDMGDGGMDMGQMFSRGPQFFGDSHRGGRGRGGKKNRGGRSSKNSRASFSADGPVNDKSKSTIVVENIPETNLSEEDVNGFFMQFGKIETMHVVPEKQLAVITYDSWDAANKAYQSPDVIFNNRFVKVFWHRRETEKSGGRGPRAGQNAHGDNESQADEIDAEEFQRRQEEAQKLHLERESQRTELEQKRQELEKQQQELLAKHRAETERLQTKLMAKSGGGSEGTGATDENGTPTGSTDMLRARLALLEQEAKILGIDPENPSPEDDGSTGGFRGGYRGRGYRARGTGRGGYAPRGRGSFRGNGARHAAYAQYSIDNRPKKVAIAGVDFSAPEKDEALRAFLIVSAWHPSYGFSVYV